MSMSGPPVVLGLPISLESLEEVARRGRAVTVDPEARKKVEASRAAIDEITAAGDAARNVYGINTGFGALSETRMSANDVRALQKNLVRSHATGIGEDLPTSTPCCANSERGSIAPARQRRCATQLSLTAPARTTHRKGSQQLKQQVWSLDHSIGHGSVDDMLGDLAEGL